MLGMSDSLVVHGGEVFTPRGWEKADVVVEHGKIRRLVRKASKGGLTLDAEGARVLPGLIDLQVNGAFGRDFAAATAAECVDVARRLASRGTTSFLATLMSLPEKQMHAAMGRLAEARGVEESILGVHLEGPFLNPERAGAHLPKNIRPPTLVEFTRLVTAHAGLVRMMTLAPEIKGALSLIAAAGRRNVLMAAGHSMATRPEMEAAAREGLRGVTHLFNATRPFHHRDEGLIGSALLDERVACTLIYDRRHVGRTAAELVWRCKPRGKVILVSDATAAMEAPDGAYDVGAVRQVVKGG